YEEGPEDGVYVDELFLEGAKWNKKEMRLADAPIIWFKPQRKSDIVETPSYACPVYKTSDRRGILSTTGHSTNFICFIVLATHLEESHWVQRGVAMLTTLDD
ncbi:unnamed protein product, partial [Ectocarpus sp. 6 AP-2014]